ncbi:RNA polymerase sigma factor [Chondrinema litorale]|uniref:RNA polymerase sigma factor n=1 Tax=Chondrinema litorale TaxID=2994555 RepID=UPI002542EA52|nr:RNA polymerase sigma-70 factor [Chondrinema litorale]UZR97123.1 RNA polymerase sigma-70 factor [Chondrinema litorale]
MNSTDEHIIALILKDDIRGYELLFKKYYLPLKKEAEILLSDEKDAEDITQQLFLEICKKQLITNKIENLPAYLIKSVKNKSLNQLKKNKKEVHFPQLPESIDFYNNPLQQLTTKEIQEVLKKNLLYLPPKCRQVFEWKYIEGFSNKEICTKAGISPNTVDNHLAKALKLLRPKLSRHFKEVVCMLAVLIYIQIFKNF